METEVAVIIVTYNALRRNWIDRCLDSIRQSTVAAVPVVVDNASTDGTVAHVQAHYPEAHVIANEENRGFGQANNQGLKHAYLNGAGHFFLLNQDARIEPDTLEHLLAVQKEHGIGVVSPVHLNGVGDALDAGFYEYVAKDNSGRSFFSSFICDNVLQAEFYPVRTINAAAWLIDRTVIETVGGFDPLFFHYGEDDNYVNRLHFHKQVLAIVPKAIMYHDRELRHGNEKLYRQHQVLNKLRMSYSDINLSALSFTKYRIQMVIKHMLTLFKSLLTLHGTDAWFVFRDYITFLWQLPKMLRHNTVNRKQSPAWLQLHG